MNIEEIVVSFKQNLIRKDGRINSPALNSKKNQTLINEIKKITSYLDKNVSISQRWWHIQNGKQVPKCNGCGGNTSWSKSAHVYNRFCTQLCAVTSEESSKRTSAQFTGKKLSENHIKKLLISRTETMNERGYYHTKKGRDNIRKSQLGENNSMFGKDVWNKGLFGKDNPMTGRKYPGKGLKGKDNPMFGKAPSPAAGKGIYGNFNGFHFRSSLEMLYLMFWYENNIEIESAESKKFRVEYLDDKGEIHTYSPDFYLIKENKIVEIKPEYLHTNSIILRKLDALQKNHLDKKVELIGFKMINEFINDILNDTNIEKFINDGLLKIKENQLNKLRRNYNDILRETNSE